MSSTIKAAILSLKSRIADAYTAIATKGGTLPATQDSANLPTAIASIPSGTPEYLPTGYTQLTYARLTSTAATTMNTYLSAMVTPKITLTMSGDTSGGKAVLLSGQQNGWWVAWLNSTSTLSVNAVTLVSATPNYTFSQFFDGEKHTITIELDENAQGYQIRFFGFQDTSFNKTRNFYDIKAYTFNDVLVSHLVPVKRMSDNALGFYDVLRQIFLDCSNYFSE